MPKRVDHEERRAHIAAALVRVAARQGLHTVTMRAVAAEAGVSVNLVQHYFDTKARLLRYTLGHLERHSHRRWDERLAALPRPRSARARLDAFVEEALPTEPDSHAFQLVWMSYAVLAMTDPELAAQPFVDGPDRLERELAALLDAARDSAELPAGRDVTLEAARLLTFSHGLGTSVLVGQKTVEEARRLVRHHLDQLFGEAG